MFGPNELGDAAFPDGFAIDEAGNVWVAVVSRNGLTIITPKGDAHVLFEQPVPAALKEIDAAHAKGEIPPSLFAACAGPELRSLTSVGFGGPALRTVFMGSIQMTRSLASTRPWLGCRSFISMQPELRPSPSWWSNPTPEARASDGAFQRMVPNAGGIMRDLRGAPPWHGNLVVPTASLPPERVVDRAAHSARMGQQPCKNS